MVELLPQAIKGNLWEYEISASSYQGQRPNTAQGGLWYLRWDSFEERIPCNTQTDLQSTEEHDHLSSAQLLCVMWTWQFQPKKRYRRKSGRLIAEVTCEIPGPREASVSRVPNRRSDDLHPVVLGSPRPSKPEEESRFPQKAQRSHGGDQSQPTRRCCSSSRTKLQLEADETRQPEPGCW